MSGVRVFDDVLKDPMAYRAEALKQEFRSFDFGHSVFHGIAINTPSPGLVAAILAMFPHLEPTLTFFRKSSAGQVEPHFIHTDIDMGDWSAILYLNPEPAEGDGTTFWTHLSTGSRASTIPHERSEEGRDPKKWALREKVQARFNRLLMFPSSYFHSRAIAENYGEGEGARLIQVVFGKGDFQ